MLKRWSLILALGLVQVGLCRADDTGGTQQIFKIDGKTIQLARYAKAFIGEGNVSVEVAPYKMGDKDGAILVFHGIESEWDGKAINHTIVPAAYQGQSYQTTWKGKPWYTLTSRNDGSGLQYEMFVPGVKDGIQLMPSDGGAELTNPLKIFQEYQQQQTQGGSSK